MVRLCHRFDTQLSRIFHIFCKCSCLSIGTLEAESRPTEGEPQHGAFAADIGFRGPTLYSHKFEAGAIAVNALTRLICEVCYTGNGYEQMHRCLHVQEIFSEIHLSMVDDGVFDPRPRRVDLANMARTCKVFFEPAVNVLWRRLGGLEAFVSYMRGPKLEESCRRKVSTAHCSAGKYHLLMVLCSIFSSMQHASSCSTWENQPILLMPGTCCQRYATSSPP